MPITQSEGSQKDKHFMHMESRKMVLINSLAGQQWRHRHKEQTSGHGEEEEGRTNRMETYILPYVKQIESENLLCDTGS